MVLGPPGKSLRSSVRFTLEVWTTIVTASAGGTISRSDKQGGESAGHVRMACRHRQSDGVGKPCWQTRGWLAAHVRGDLRDLLPVIRTTGGEAMIYLNDSAVVRRGGTALTTSTRRRLAACTIAAGLVSLGFIPAAFAQGIPFTDANGNTCTTDETIEGPGGTTICPQSAGKGGGSANNPTNPNLNTPFQRSLNKVVGDPGFDQRISAWGSPPQDPGLYDRISAWGSPPQDPGLYDRISAWGNESDTSPAHLGMYTSPYGGTGGLQGNGFSVSGTGSAITDSSGAFGGTRTLGFTGSGGGGGIYGMIYPMPNLELGGSFDYQHVNINFDGAGSEQADEYTFAGYLKYYWQDFYARAAFSYSFGPANTFNAATSATGSFNTTGLNGDVEAGHVFTLADTISGAAPGLITKGPAPAPAGGYGLLLDLSGHGGYDSALSDGFTDSTGFTLGTARYEFGDIGAKAKLEALLPTPSILWIPYVEATIDQHLGTIDQLYVPAQGGVAIADLVKYSDANTFFGGRIGLSTEMRSGLSFGVNGFVSASSDLNIVGGQAFAKVQF
jgi:hypothetical protein